MIFVLAAREIETCSSEAALPKPIIAHVLHRLYLAGAEVLAAALARQMRDRFDFHFLCLDEVGPLGEQLASEGFNVVDLQRKPGVDLSVARRIRALTKEHGIELLHAHQYTPFFYASASRGIWGSLTSSPRLLFTEHGRHYPDIRKTKRVFANKLLLRKRDQVTAVGNFVKQALVNNEGIAQQRIEVVYNGIDTDRFQVDTTGQVRAAVRAELSIAADRGVVLQVARFHPVKDHATAVRAFAAAAGTFNEANKPLLLLVGDGDEREKIESLIAQLQVSSLVRFLGVRSDIPRLMSAADVFMLSSLSEGISVTLLEAMGAAIPIAATNVGGNGEVVAHGESGLLSPRSEHAALGVSLATLLRDPLMRQRMGEAGRARLLATFTQQQMHKRYAEIYEQITRHRAALD